MSSNSANLVLGRTIEHEHAPVRSMFASLTCCSIKHHNVMNFIEVHILLPKSTVYVYVKLLVFNLEAPRSKLAVAC